MKNVYIGTFVGGVMLALLFVSAMGCIPDSMQSNTTLALISKASGIFGCRGCNQSSNIEEAATELLERFATADIDNDGLLSMQETMVVLDWLTIAQFTELDLNNDNFLSMDELQQVLGQAQSEGEVVQGEGEPIEGEEEPNEGEQNEEEGPTVQLDGDTLTCLDSTIIVAGVEYAETVDTIDTETLVGVVSEEKAYLYHPALGDVTLSDETSRRAVGYWIAKNFNNAEKALDVTQRLGTGIDVSPDTSSSYIFENVKKRWAAVDSGVTDKPIFLPQRGPILDINITTAIIGAERPYSFAETATETIPVDAEIIKTYGAIVRNPLWPFIVGTASLTKNSPKELSNYVAEIWVSVDEAMEQDMNTFVHVNAVDTITQIAEGAGHIIGLIPGECADAVIDDLLITSLESALVQVFTGGQNAAQLWVDTLDSFSQGLVKCALSEGTGVGVVVSTLLDIIGAAAWLIDDGILGAYDSATSLAYDTVEGITVEGEGEPEEGEPEEGEPEEGEPGEGEPGEGEGEYDWIYNPATGSEYKLTTLGCWDDAEAYAQANGAHLVEINDQAENDWLVSTFGDTTAYALWIGLNDESTEGTWVWSNGGNSSFRNWDKIPPNVEPNSLSTTENWVFLYPRDAASGSFLAGTWNDADNCIGESLPGIMERPLNYEGEQEGEEPWSQEYTVNGRSHVILEELNGSTAVPVTLPSASTYTFKLTASTFQENPGAPMSRYVIVAGDSSLGNFRTFALNGINDTETVTTANATGIYLFFIDGLTSDNSGSSTVEIKTGTDLLEEVTVDSKANTIVKELNGSSALSVSLPSVGTYTFSLTASDFRENSGVPASQYVIVGADSSFGDYRTFTLNGIGDNKTITVEGSTMYLYFIDGMISDNSGSSTVQITQN